MERQPQHWHSWRLQPALWNVPSFGFMWYFLKIRFWIYILTSLLSMCIMSGSTWSSLSPNFSVNLDTLVEVASARFFHCEVKFFVILCKILFWNWVNILFSNKLLPSTSSIHSWYLPESRITRKWKKKKKASRTRKSRLSSLPACHVKSFPIISAILNILFRVCNVWDSTTSSEKCLL